MFTRATRVRTLLAATFMVVVMGAAAGSPGSAQTVPATPPLPEEAQPAVGVVAPAAQGVAGPVCSSLSGGLALALIVGSVVAGDQASAVSPIYQEVLTAQVAVCGALPPQPRRTTCAPDAEVGKAIATAAAPAGEAGAPVDPTTVLPRPRAIGGAVDSIRAAEALADGQGSPNSGAGDEAGAGLSCQTEIIGGEFVPRSFDPAATDSAPGETPLGAAGPAPGHAGASVVTDPGGTGPTTGAADTRSMGESSLTDGPAPADASDLAAGTTAGATQPVGGGKAAVLVALGLLTALSFLPSRART